MMVVEGEGAHGLAIGVSLFVSAQRLRMAMRHAVLANEHQRVTFPVALHEAFEISGIPSLFLQPHDLSHLLWHPREGD